jgi:predicted enzyme related to lactoylglutathione lyase
MIDFNSTHNRVVWLDIPVADVERAAAFYRAMLGIPVPVERSSGSPFAVLDHRDGNGACLVPKPGEVSGHAGVLIYLNANGRIRDAVREAERMGGRIVEPPTPIGPHGVRAIVIDSEGNRVALHANADG